MYADTSSTADTVAIADTTIASRVDTIAARRLPMRIGTLEQFPEPHTVLRSDDLSWLEFSALDGAIATLPGVHLRDQQSIGQYNGLTIRGEDWRSIAILMNGRLMNDPAAGVYNFYKFSAEYVEQMEVITGTRAFLYGLNATGGAVNLVTKNYLANRPFSKIYFTQGPYNYQYSDGSFAQNITRDFNFSFGFQHNGTDGRFTNGAYDAWNVRSKMRYEPEPDFNVILSWYFTSTKSQLNGGVDVDSQITTTAFSALSAPVMNREANERVFRHDVDLTLSGQFLGDTNSVSTLTLYYAADLREYRDEARSAPTRPLVKSDQRSSMLGGTLSQTVATSWQAFNIAGSAELRQIDASPNLGRRRNFIGSVSTKEEFFLPQNVTLAGYARLDRYLRDSYVGYGGDIRWKLFDEITVSGGFSASRRVPTYPELYWSGSPVNRATSIVAERHRLFEAGIGWQSAGIDRARLTFFHRNVKNPILFTPYDAGTPFPGVNIIQPSSETKINGVEGSFRFRFWRIELDGTITYLSHKNDALGGRRLFPEFSGQGGVYYVSEHFDGSLEIKTGIRGRIVTKHHGAVFNPEVLAYAANSGPMTATGSSADFLMIAHIGSAYIHLLWQNLISTKYFLTPYYPVEDRSVRFGIAWEFMD